MKPNLQSKDSVILLFFSDTYKSTTFEIIFLFQVAATALESSLIKYSAKEYFFRASLCHLCVDAVNAQHAIQRYEEQFPAFGDSRECKLVKVGRSLSHILIIRYLLFKKSYFFKSRKW